MWADNVLSAANNGDNAEYYYWRRFYRWEEVLNTATTKCTKTYHTKSSSGENCYWLLLRKPRQTKSPQLSARLNQKLFIRGKLWPEEKILEIP